MEMLLAVRALERTSRGSAQVSAFLQRSSSILSSVLSKNIEELIGFLGQQGGSLFQLLASLDLVCYTSNAHVSLPTNAVLVNSNLFPAYHLDFVDDQHLTAIAHDICGNLCSVQLAQS
jgi:hypothetical protein